jgi:hypothetical protein
MDFAKVGLDIVLGRPMGGSAERGHLVERDFHSGLGLCPTRQSPAGTCWTGNNAKYSLYRLCMRRLDIGPFLISV